MHLVHFLTASKDFRAVFEFLQLMLSDTHQSSLSHDKAVGGCCRHSSISNTPPRQTAWEEKSNNQDYGPKLSS